MQNGILCLGFGKEGKLFLRCQRLQMLSLIARPLQESPETSGWVEGDNSVFNGYVVSRFERTRQF